MNIRIIAFSLFLLSMLSIILDSPSQSNGGGNGGKGTMPQVLNSNAANATDINLSGSYISDNQDKYFLKQVNNTVWWIGTNKNDSNITNIFNGKIEKDKITGQWVDSPLLKTNGTGNLVMDFSYTINNNITIYNISSGKEFPLRELVKLEPESLIKPRYLVSIDTIRIEHTRSPTQDTIYTGISAKKDNEDPVTATKFIGSRNDNSNITLNLGVGPFEVDKDDKYLTISYMAVDKDGSRTTDNLLNLRETMSELLDPSYNLTSFWDTPSIIRSLSPGLLPGGCNGLVFADKLVISSQELKNLTHKGKYTHEEFFQGYDSPPGCGTNSKYFVKWSIAPVE
ncbi:MAG: hypothetical protein M3162_03950 [Thermoproteota archaeon]|nr:hypothetical protein [Thermoproteota archaeon]